VAQFYSGVDIGVDPYYLTHKAEALGYHPQVILAGRRINDGMGAYVAGQMVKAMLKKRIQVDGARVLVLGLTFKENCPDLRNTRVVDVVAELAEYGINVDIHDPWANAEEARHEYGLEIIDQPQPGQYDGIVLAVAHSSFAEGQASALRRLGKANHVLYDLKHLFDASQSDIRL
jgi:UDP-N-acetyl-D-galactosamine dehydrogenase